MTSRGKLFETEISRMFQAGVNGVAHIRHHPDLPGRRFTLTNPIDFTGCLQGGRGLFIECKATNKSASLPYSKFSDGQWEALLCCHRAGASVWVFLNWYSKPRGQAYAIPFKILARIRVDRCQEGQRQPRRSWRLKHLVNQPGVIELEPVTQPKASWRWKLIRT